MANEVALHIYDNHQLAVQAVKAGGGSVAKMMLANGDLVVYASDPVLDIKLRGLRFGSFELHGVTPIATSLVATLRASCR